MKPKSNEETTPDAKLRKWLKVARAGWSYPLEKDEATALLDEIDRLRADVAMLIQKEADACNAE